MDIQKVAYVAELSRIQLDDQQFGLMQAELGKILHYMEILQAVDTDGVAPLSHVFPVTNVVRSDAVSGHFDRALLLRNAPVCSEEAFIVPKAV